MDTVQIFKKTLGLVWRYRALWLFGFLLALTINNALWLVLARNDENVMVENRIVISETSSIYFPGQGLTIDFSSPGNPVVDIEGLEPDWYRDLAEDSSMSDIWAVLISIGVVLLISTLLAIMFRFTSEAALICMIDEYERSERMVGVGRGLRLGWSRVAGKLFLIDLSIILPVILVFTLLFFLATSPLFLLGQRGATESLVSIFSSIFFTAAGLLLFAFLAFTVTIILSITRPVMHQACVVDGLSVIASIRQGFSLLKTRFTEVLTTWLVWLAVRLVWTVAIIPGMIILFPVILLTMVVGILAGAALTLLAAGIVSQIVSSVFAWIIGIIFALPLFLIITFSPLIFLNGLVAVFKSSFWTLSYRAFRPVPSAAPQPVDISEKARLDAALAQRAIWKG